MNNSAIENHSIFSNLKKITAIFPVLIISFFMHSYANAQADILSGLSPDQLAQFNQLPPAQRQALLSQLQVGETAGFELPVSQPQTVNPRLRGSIDNGVNDNASTVSSVAETDIEERDELRVRQERVETPTQRILRKAQELFNLGIDVVALDTYGELAQMGIIQAIQGGGESSADDGEETGDFTEGRLNTVSRNRNGPLEPFGYDLFAGIPSTFAPATDIPIPTNYIVGPGDTVVLQLYGQLNVRYELAVSREGLIQFPEVGPLNVSGLSFEDMSVLIQTTVDNTLIGQQVSITMGQLRSVQIFMLGEAYQPGIYTVSSLATMTNALFSSGGVSDLGTLRDIRLIRDGELLATLDLYDLLLTGDTSSDERLQPNDVIFIPTMGRTVGISGEVLRPAIFELSAEETLQDVLNLAGRLLPTAYPALAHIERVNPFGQRTIIDLDLSNEGDLASAVIDGDLIQVDMILDQIEFGVSIEGHVFRPDTFAWEDGKRISDILNINDLRPLADFNYALLVREIQPSRRIQVHQVNLAEVFASQGSGEDMLLEARDRLLVFGEDSLENRLDRRLLIHPLIQTLSYQSEQGSFRAVTSVAGSVAAPGDYPLVANMAIADLLMAAGGPLESADLSQAELTKNINTLERGMVSESMVVNLTDSLTLSSALNSLDLLTVRQIPNWGAVETVFIGGEVRSPGTYVIGRDDRLSDLIQRAGGLTDYADPKAGIFLREELRQNEQRLLDDFNQRLTRDILSQSLTRTTGQLQTSQVNVEVMAQLLEQIESVVPTGRLVIDLPALLSGINPEEDVILRDQDELLIPRTRQEISVIGEVQLPTSHLYNGSDTIFNYIDRSGGYTRNADEGNIFVIKSSGEVIPYSRNRRSLFSFSDSDNFSLESGDSIVVPYFARLESPLVTWMNVSTVLFNLSTTVLALQSIGRLD
ncbi:SLBB domain-containing protein [Haliea sp. AH-315-K21]|uniref:Sugar transporter n=1 Tax=SAR86 cluster bacterium TaxID=2030880 RepID=A0A2A5CAF5_9GAMM|nr:SLBB domain-containing protein [Haliea sp. AH-315-K21]MBN4075776.1 SLBB domain-containing protein [Gammaproteobacteria bacterium AH-315-E17]PCJ40420.1 MAG: hypothetical protein COA71_11235 [SAR86 cluster bacterium]